MDVRRVVNCSLLEPNISRKQNWRAVACQVCQVVDEVYCYSQSNVDMNLDIVKAHSKRARTRRRNAMTRRNFVNVMQLTCADKIRKSQKMLACMS